MTEPKSLAEKVNDPKPVPRGGKPERRAEGRPTPNSASDPSAGGTAGEIPYPLFIVGSPRSGTSILVDAMLAAGFHGYREGNFLGLLKTMTDAIETHYRSFFVADTPIMISQVPKQRLIRQIRGMFKDLLEEKNLEHPWLDKTGNSEMILLVPDLTEIWPNCRVIFAKRRGIENVMSRMKKFPEANFGYHCRDWARNMAAWRATRARLEDWRYLEVDQKDIAFRPDVVAKQISALLSLSPTQGAAIEEMFRSGRPQETAPGTAERVVALQDTGWPAEQMVHFQTLCGLEMEEFGYTMDVNDEQVRAVGSA